MNPTVLFAGGGTGGHIFPALAIAEHLRELADIRIRFLCSNRAIDAKILSEAGEEFTVTPAAPFSLSPARFVKFARGWHPSLAIITDAIEKSGTHTLLVAMGGFVAAPAVAAAKNTAPVVLVNLDAAPGRANMWIAKRAAVILSAAHVDLPKWQNIPPIVRRTAIADAPASDCRARLGLDRDAPTLFITGGSQGARSLNQLATALAHRHADVLRAGPWQVIHQTGRDDVAKIRREYQAAGVTAIVEPFFTQMGQAWGAADLALSRAGAGSVAEAWANNTPTVFLPYPYHKDQHQRRNAEHLVTAGAAVLCTDAIDPEANLRDAGRVLLEMMRDEASRRRCRAAYDPLGPVDGAAQAAARIHKAFSLCQA